MDIHIDLSVDGDLYMLLVAAPVICRYDIRSEAEIFYDQRRKVGAAAGGTLLLHANEHCRCE
jgi:hypothetical protein